MIYKALTEQKEKEMLGINQKIADILSAVNNQDQDVDFLDKSKIDKVFGEKRGDSNMFTLQEGMFLNVNQDDIQNIINVILTFSYYGGHVFLNDNDTNNTDDGLAKNKEEELEMDCPKEEKIDIDYPKGKGSDIYCPKDEVVHKILEFAKEKDKDYQLNEYWFLLYNHDSSNLKGKKNG